jgi:hypothetical protein
MKLTLFIYIEKCNSKPTPISIISPTIYKRLQMFPIFHLRFVFLAHIAITFRLGGIKLGEIAKMGYIYNKENAENLDEPFVIV